MHNVPPAKFRGYILRMVAKREMYKYSAVLHVHPKFRMIMTMGNHQKYSYREMYGISGFIH